MHGAEVFDERSQAEKFGKKAQLALASGGGEETAQAVTQTLEDIKQGELASGLWQLVSHREVHISLATTMIFFMFWKCSPEL